MEGGCQPSIKGQALHVGAGVGRMRGMRIAPALGLVAVGGILASAVTFDVPGIDVNALGAVLFWVGLLWLAVLVWIEWSRTRGPRPPRPPKTPRRERERERQPRAQPADRPYEPVLPPRRAPRRDDADAPTRPLPRGDDPTAPTEVSPRRKP